MHDFKVGDVVTNTATKGSVVTGFNEDGGMEVYMLDRCDPKHDTFSAWQINQFSFVRRATPAECRAAGLDPAGVGPVNGEAPVKFPRPSWSATGPLESPTPSAREAELERERDDARYLRAMAVVDRDAAIRDAAEQRKRADAAEAACARLSIDNESLRACAWENAACVRDSLRLKPTPAPATTPTLTVEDVAFIHAQQVVWDRSDNVLFMDTPERLECRDKARNAIAARAKGA